MVTRGLLNLTAKGHKACVWIIRDCMVPLLRLILKKKTELADTQAFFLVEDPLLDHAVEVVYFVWNTLIDEAAETIDASLVLKPDDCAKMRSSGIDALAGKICDPDDAGLTFNDWMPFRSHERCFKLAVALAKCDEVGAGDFDPQTLYSNSTSKYN